MLLELFLYFRIFLPLASLAAARFLGLDADDDELDQKKILFLSVFINQNSITEVIVPVLYSKKFLLCDICLIGYLFS